MSDLSQSARCSKKVLFIYPNSSTTPSIPGVFPILKGIVRDEGWETKLFDTYIYEKVPNDTYKDREISGEFKWSGFYENLKVKPLKNLLTDLQKMIDEFIPDVIAITCMSVQYDFLKTFFHNVRLPNDCVVIGGGIHMILAPIESAKSGLFDLVCTGEGEDVFTELLRNKCDGRNISGISGTIYFDRKENCIVNNGMRPILSSQELWKVRQDYSLFLGEYFKQPFDGKILNKLTFECSRGCPYSCTYCGNTALKEAMNDGKSMVRLRSIDSIMENLKILVNNLDIQIISLIDECFFAKPNEWLQEFSERYADEIQVPFIIQTRPEMVTDERIQILNKTNVSYYQVGIGVESGSERILFDVCNRKIKLSTIKEAFNILSKYSQVKSCALFMIGFPFETREEIFKTIQLCREIKPKVAHVSIFQPFIGQKLREVCIKEGFITGNESQMSYTEGSILKMPQISQREILNLRRVFMLYAKCPEEHFHSIELCENDFEENQSLYRKLVDLCEL